VTENPYKRRVPRRDRRVMLALLSDAANLGGYAIMNAARIGTPYLALARMERLGWVTREREYPEPANRPPRTFYRLTAEGRANVMRLLGLQERAS